MLMNRFKRLNLLSNLSEVSVGEIWLLRSDESEVGELRASVEFARDGFSVGAHSSAVAGLVVDFAEGGKVDREGSVGVGNWTWKLLLSEAKAKFPMRLARLSASPLSSHSTLISAAVPQVELSRSPLTSSDCGKKTRTSTLEPSKTPSKEVKVLSLVQKTPPTETNLAS